MKTFEVKSFSERKGLLSHMLARKETRPGHAVETVSCKAISRRQHVCYPGVMRLFYAMRLEKEDVSCFRKIYIHYR